MLGGIDDRQNLIQRMPQGIDRIGDIPHDLSRVQTMRFLDVETCGFHGVPILLQHAIDDGEIKMWDFWREPIEESIALLEEIAAGSVCAFNLAFDWFHLYKFYTMLVAFNDWSAIPEEHINEFAEIEESARLSEWCLKPKSCCDLMLHARSGPYQSLMDRDDIRIKRVPSALAFELAKVLEEQIKFDDIYFARRKDKFAPKWSVEDVTMKDGSDVPHLKNIVLRFHPSGSLKNLALHTGLASEYDLIRYSDIDVNIKVKEYGYAPFAKAVGSQEDWNGAWPEVVRIFIRHWGLNQHARRYATNDVRYTRALYGLDCDDFPGKKFDFGCPEPGDNNSELAAMVACNRWRGYAIDVEQMKKLRLKAIKAAKKAPIAPRPAKHYIMEVLDDDEKVIIQGSTKKAILEELSTWEDHPAAERAKNVLRARAAEKEKEIYDKLIRAGRFHASFKVIGARSDRMSGTDGLNPQGIKATNEVRRCFPLSDSVFRLSGGDFDAFEVVLAEAVFADPKLREQLLSGKKIHALLGAKVYQKTYEEILESKGTEQDLYKKGKNCVFTVIYGGDWNTWHKRYGVDEEVGRKAFDQWMREYPVMAKKRQEIFDQFCSMRQPGGIGSKVEWHEPSDYISSLFGFKRYFTLENKVCRTLFELAQKPPKSWKNVQIKVVRRDREQTASGAVQSALYGAAFAIQAANMRAAANHVIQSSGANITKHVQRRIWDIQPPGAHHWRVQPLNVHDEVLTPTHPDYVNLVEETVNETVESYRNQVPLILMNWSKELVSWAEK